MATTPITPTPPPYKYRRPRTLFGPIMLITIGVLFMLANLRLISIVDVYRWFALYWPAILILWGVLKLVEYMQAKSSGEPYRGVGGGGIVLMVFLLIFGTSISGVYHFSQGRDWSKFRENINIDDNDWGDIWGDKYDFSGTLDHDFPANSSVRVVVEHGDVKIEPSPDAKVHVSYTQHVYGSSQDEASKYRATVTPTINMEGSTMTVDSSRKGDWKGGSVDLTIQVPRKASVDITTIRGNVDVHDRDGSVKVVNGHGDVDVENVTGTVHTDMNGSFMNGNFSAHQIKGDVFVNGRGNEIKVGDVSGVFDLTGEYNGDIELGSLGKGFRFKSARSDMEIAKVDGEIRMSSGDLRAEKISGPIRLQTKSKDIHLEDASGEIHIEDSNSEIEVQPKAPYGSVDITNKSGNVTFTVPPKAGFNIDARASNGDLDDEFNLPRTDQNHDRHVSGAVNGGGPAVHINTSHDTVSIRKQ